MRVANEVPLSRLVITGAGVPISMGTSMCDVGQLQVINGDDGRSGVVEDLPVQQVQFGVEDLPGVPLGRFAWYVAVVIGMSGHAPAPVTIMSGIAATDAARMMTR